MEKPSLPADYVVPKALGRPVGKKSGLGGKKVLKVKVVCISFEKEGML